jgi:hypothetical protein
MAPITRRSCGGSASSPSRSGADRRALRGGARAGHDRRVRRRRGDRLRVLLERVKCDNAPGPHADLARFDFVRLTVEGDPALTAALIALGAEVAREILRLAAPLDRPDLEPTVTAIGRDR